jgi:hypothetical protein
MVLTTKWRGWFMWKKKEKKQEETKEEKEESLLKELCGDDAELFDLLSRSLYLDPVAAIPKTSLESLIEEAEKSIKDGNYGEAMPKYGDAMDKAILEATQNPGERARYIKIAQDLASKTAKVTEKVKEKREKEGLASPHLEGRIKRYESMSERIEDVIKIASLFYNEILEELGAKESREARRRERVEAEGKEERKEKEAKESRAAKEKGRKGMGRAERKEAEREDEVEEKKENERREARRKEGIEAEREENKTKERDKERRETRRKEKR